MPPTHFPTVASSRARDPAGCDLQPSPHRRLTDLGYRTFGLGLVLGLLATITGSRVLLGTGAFAVLLPWLTMLTLPGRDVEVAVDVPVRSRVASPAVVHVHVRNPGRRTLPPLELRWARPLFRSEQGCVGAVLPGATAVWTLEAVPLARGISSHGHVEVVVPDLLGLSLRRVPVRSSSRVPVGPRAVTLPVSLPSAAGGLPLEPADLRSWRSGDGAAAVAWRASARRFGPRSSLVVRDRAPEQQHLLHVGLSGGAPTEVERALELLAAVAVELTAEGRRFEIRLGPRQLGPVGVEVLLDELASLDVSTVVPLPADGAAPGLIIACRGTPPHATGTTWLVDAAGWVEVA